MIPLAEITPFLAVESNPGAPLGLFAILAVSVPGLLALILEIVRIRNKRAGDSAVVQQTKAVIDHELWRDTVEELKGLRVENKKLNAEVAAESKQKGMLQVEVEFQKSSINQKDELNNQLKKKNEELEQNNIDMRHRATAAEAALIKVKTEINAMDVAAQRVGRFPEVGIASLLTAASAETLSHAPAPLPPPTRPEEPSPPTHGASSQGHEKP